MFMGMPYISNQEKCITSDESPINDNSTFGKMINEEGVCLLGHYIVLRSLLIFFLELFTSQR